MASLIRDPNGRFRVQVSRTDGRRSTIRLGKVPKNHATYVKSRIEDLDAARRMGASPSPETAQWLAIVDSRLIRRLSVAGLVVLADRSVHTLATAAARMLEESTAQPQTRRHHEDLHAALAAHLGGKDRNLATITPAEAHAFRRWLEEHYAPATVAKQIKRCRQLFTYAVKRGMIAESPFAEVRAGSQSNPARQAYIDVPTINRVLAACPDARWRLIVGLARFAGLRVPSELFALRWADVRADRLRVESPKTAGQGKPERFVPITPSLRPILEDFTTSVPPSRRVPTWRLLVPPAGSTEKALSTTNLRTGLMDIITAAGLKAWPKLYHNLRASCQTDLESQFPTHVVCAWLGNTPKVASEHYLQVREDDWRKACSATPK
jgi:site-specific recombinase XerD